jgi:hypothetical protein
VHLIRLLACPPDDGTVKSCAVVEPSARRLNTMDRPSGEKKGP